MIETENSYPLSKIIEVMKPAKVDLNKPSHRTKLEEMYKSSEYVAELKIDGCHYVNVAGRFFSTQISAKTGVPVEKTGNFPHLVEGLLRANMGNVILDGEIYKPGWKSYDVTTISGCKHPETAIARQKETGWIRYMVFDILRAPNGEWLFDKPWRVRRELLETVLTELNKECDYFDIVPVRRSRKQQYLEDLLASGQEGIVLKNVNGYYYVGTRPMWNWVKIKAALEDDVIIMGYEPPKKDYTGREYETWQYWENGEPVSKHYYMGWIGTIVFGKFDAKGELVRLGSCSGMSEEERIRFTNDGDNYIGKVMKISAMEKTPDGYYRHPNFLEIHADKNPHECVISNLVVV